jgi:hypothetical protein
MSNEKMIGSDASDIRASGGREVTNDGDDAAANPILPTSELVDMVTGATWAEALRRLGEPPSNPLPLWILLASRILRAVADGERDPQRLKRIALDGLNDERKSSD